MPLLREQVEHIARLSRLKLPPEEIEEFPERLTIIIDYMDQLKLADTEGIMPQSLLVEDESVFRRDEVFGSLPRGKALSNAPDKDNEYFRVPRVIG